MNKFERLLARIAGKGDDKSLKTETRIEKMLQEISDRLDAGTVPAPAKPADQQTPSADAGKVPTVQDDGTYALASGGGGSGGMLEITATDFGEGGTLDKTYSEIVSAISAGKIPMVTYQGVHTLLLNYTHFEGEDFNVSVYAGNNSENDFLFTSQTEDGTLTFNDK